MGLGLLQRFEWRGVMAFRSGRVLSGSFFRISLFSTTWPGSFLASFFPQERIFNNFPASFLGSFGFVFGGQSFIISNFSASFSKLTSFLSHAFEWPKATAQLFQQLMDITQSTQTA
ncbi:MAG TPA: hypothetical protein VNM47_20610 [Terriglobia bacterium]|nr:hypothetical protein [Terriglobia bacterium]